MSNRHRLRHQLLKLFVFVRLLSEYLFILLNFLFFLLRYHIAHPSCKHFDSFELICRILVIRYPPLLLCDLLLFSRNLLYNRILKHFCQTRKLLVLLFSLSSMHLILYEVGHLLFDSVSLLLFGCDFRSSYEFHLFVLRLNIAKSEIHVTHTGSSICQIQNIMVPFVNGVLTSMR